MKKYYISLFVLLNFMVSLVNAMELDGEDYGMPHGYLKQAQGPNSQNFANDFDSDTSSDDETDIKTALPEMNLAKKAIPQKPLRTQSQIDYWTKKAIRNPNKYVMIKNTLFKYEKELKHEEEKS